MEHTATYSPEDNKLRLYPSCRLDDETFRRVKAAGFKWAPRQELFVAPMWTPSREDLLIELCGEVGDEDTSLVDRAEERADRFSDYSVNRTADAESARKAVSAIADNIPFGQPILVGHHSEKHARRDAEKIENGMRRAVKMWETAKYWQQRAAGAISHAKYKERPDVRHRRISKLEAEARKIERSIAAANREIWAWNIEEKLTPELALHVANASGVYACFPLDRYPRQLPASQYEGAMSLWSALKDGIITPDKAREIAVRQNEGCLEQCQRWKSHYENRIAYERAMLGEQGGIEADRTKPEKGGACRCWASPGFGKGWSFIKRVNKVSVTVEDNWGNGGRNFTRTIPFDKLAALMSKADVDAAREQGRLHECSNGIGFYLDEPAETREAARDRVHKEAVSAAEERQTTPASDENVAEVFDAMKSVLRAGVAVEVVAAPQLFPTPDDLAARVVELAEIEPGHRVLEPSAGTGALLAALPNIRPGGEVVAVEINPQLAERLRQVADDTHCKDFLECEDLGTFDRIVMNPPFANGDDIKHIRRARTLLKPGGRLVAICANGPRQQRQLAPLADAWIDLPAGSFAESGTNVNTAIVVLSALEFESPLAATGGGDDFVLANDPPRRRRKTFATEKHRQRMLLDGLDCIPGQGDLF